MLLTIRMMRNSEGVQTGIMSLDEHWDGDGKPIVTWHLILRLEDQRFQIDSLALKYEI